MFKIQKLTVSNPNSLTPSIRLTIADSAVIDEASAHLVASVTIDRKTVPFENIELDAIGKIREIVDQASAAVNATSDEVRKKQSGQ